jgi:mRNA-degrading endonuclease toxin of MazEF toxin-antitoxin module
MASRLNRAEIWLLERPRPDKRRPVLILNRPSLLAVLNTATVAAITSTRRGSPTEVDLGVEEGLKGPCCVNLCHVFTVAQTDLRRFVGSVGPDKMRAICRALSIATSCD